MIIGIFAVDENGGLGRNGSLPWKCSEDMKWFKNTTTNNVVVMGSKTWESTGYLPNRKNVIITSRQLNNLKQDVLIINENVCSNIVALQNNNKLKDVFIIGGPNILLQTKPILEQLCITKIPGNYNCDVSLNLTEFLVDFKLMKQLNFNMCTVEEYERISKSSCSYTS